MPRGKKAKKAETVIAPPTPAAETPPTTEPVPTPAPVNPDGLELVHDRLTIVEHSSASKVGPLTPAQAKLLLDWETEPEFQKRMVAEKGGKLEHYLYGDLYHCVNEAEEKVRCNNNANNRPFDPKWCKDLGNMILLGQWAGPLTCPGETINGETVRIGRYGRVLSGQHQLTALIRADEKLQESRRQEGNAVNPMWPFWSGHPYCVIETIVITGLSEDERILRTIDYVKPRTVADMLHTMPLYKDSVPVERKELTRMLAAAIDLLWDRTQTLGYRTHPEVVGFLQRHNRLLKTVAHIFKENGAGRSGNEESNRAISKLKISAGQCAALLYLMGCSDTQDADVEYRNEKPAPSEKNLNWDYWDRAKEFWSNLAKTAETSAFFPVRQALGRLVDSTPDNDENPGQGGRHEEKLSILAKAWRRFKGHKGHMGEIFTESDLEEDGCLHLDYTMFVDKKEKLPGGKFRIVQEKLPDGQVSLIREDDFLGIDAPNFLSPLERNLPGRKKELEATRKEVERAKDEEHKKKVKEQQK